MTVSTYLASVTRTVLAPLFSTPDQRLGADHVQAAINESAAITNRQFTATLDEPELKDFGGMFQPDWKVVINVAASDYEDPGPLVFDLPRGNDDESALFYTLMDTLQVDEIGDIEGVEVPMEVVGGNPMVLWDVLTDPSKGTEENPITADDIADESDEGGDAEDDV